jgi:hypothetical protein
MMHTDTTVSAQRARVSNTHVREASNCHQNNEAINQLSRHRRQHAPVLHSEGIVVIERLNRRRARQGGNAEVRIEFAMLSSQRKAAKEWETSTYTWNVGVRASTCSRHINNKMTVSSHEVQPTHIPMTISRSSRPNAVDLKPQVPPLSSPRFKHELVKHVDNPVVELNDMARARDRGMSSINIADVERSPDIEAPDTVDEDTDPRDFEGASLHRGHFRT